VAVQNNKEGTPKRFSPKAIGWLFMFGFIFFVAFVVAISFFVYQQAKTHDEEAFGREQIERLSQTQNLLLSWGTGIITDLRILSNHTELIKFVDTGSSTNKKTIQQEWQQFSGAKKVYDQIRYIDKTGQEIIRVDYEDEGPIIVSDENLQDKSGRYYFDESIGLAKNEVYVSPIDLNVERGEIELPFKSMMRVATSIHKGDQTEGVLLLNYKAQNFIDSLGALVQGDESILYVANEDGYWIMGPSADVEYGFMFEDKLNERASITHPELWSVVTSGDDEGQVITKKGMYTFMVRRTLVAYQAIAGITPDQFSTALLELSPFEQPTYYIVYFVPQDVLYYDSDRLFEVLVVGSAIFLIIIGIGTVLLGRATKARFEAEQEIIKLNDVLRIITKTLRHDLANVFTGIRGLLDLYKEKKDQRNLDTAHAESIRGINIITQMRQLERSIASGEESKPYKLKRTINDIAKGYKIGVIINGNGVVIADEALSAVFNNIVGNAVKHGGAKEIRVDIKKAKKRMIEIRITNYGKTIPEKDIGRIFEEGFTVGETGGMGMGLNIVQKTIDRYGGTIHAENIADPGGVSFVITMPGKITK